MGKTSKVKGSQVRKNPNGVEPIFSISILPRTMSLPMVCEPLPWTYVGSDNMGLTAKRVPSFSDLCMWWIQLP
jgi:hypothetical protein